MNNISSSKFLKIIIVSLLGLIVLIVVFRAGIVFGVRQAMFASHFGENYERNFLGHNVVVTYDNHSLPFDHGTVGEIIKINDSNLVVKADNGVEGNVIVATSTLIQKFQDSIKITDLKTGDRVVVIGSPDTSGQIEAKLIRVFPPTSTGTTTGFFIPAQ